MHVLRVTRLTAENGYTDHDVIYDRSRKSVEQSPFVQEKNAHAAVHVR